MQDKKITQSQLATMAGVSQAFISYVMKGYKVPSVSVLKRISEYLDISIDELVND